MELCMPVVAAGVARVMEEMVEQVVEGVLHIMKLRLLVGLQIGKEIEFLQAIVQYIIVAAMEKLILVAVVEGLILVLIMGVKFLDLVDLA